MMMTIVQDPWLGQMYARKVFTVDRYTKRTVKASTDGHPTLYIPAEEPVGSIHDFGRLIREIAAGDDEVILVRGDLLPKVRSDIEAGKQQAVRRMMDPTREEAAFRATARRWVVFDVDGLNMPASLDIVDGPASCVQWFVETYLPDAFQGVTYYWRISGSAGVKSSSELRAHICFWFTRPVADIELKNWLRPGQPTADDPTRVPIDGALFNAVQAHYVMPPLFFDGAVDPFAGGAGRDGFHNGDTDAVVPPDGYDKVGRQDWQPEQRTYTGGLAGGVDSFERSLSLVGDGQGLRGAHEGITRAIYAYVAAAPIGEVDFEALKARIRDQSATAPWDPGRADHVAKELSDTVLDKSIAGAIRYHQARLLGETTPAGTRGRVDLKTARGHVRTEAAAWFKTESTVRLLTGAVGIGKSQIVIEQLAALPDLATELRIYVVQTHELAEEMVERLRQAVPDGVHVRRWQGQLRRVPKPPDEAKKSKAAKRRKPGVANETMPAVDDLGRPMCFEEMHEKCQAVTDIGRSAPALVCPNCAFRERCGTMAQRSDTGPGIIVMPHAFLPLPHPKPASYVIDESPISAMRQVKNKAAALAGLVDGRAVVRKRHKNDLGEWIVEDDEEATARLAEIQGRMRSAFEAAGTDDRGRWRMPSLEELRAVGLDRSMCEEAARFERRRAEMAVGRHRIARLPPSAIRALATNLQGIQSDRLVRVWTVIGQQLEFVNRNRVYGVDVTADPPPPRKPVMRPATALEVYLRNTVVSCGGDDDPWSRQWLSLDVTAELRHPDVPALILDATPAPALLRRWWPELEETTAMQVKAPHARVVQIRQAMPKWRLDPPKKSARGRASLVARRRIAEVERMLLMLSVAYSSVGAITHKVLLEDLTKRGRLPDTVLSAHYNALRGLDRMRNVDAAMVLGRPLMPSTAAVAAARAIWFGTDIEIGDGNYEKGVDWIQMRNGAAKSVQVLMHRDPRVEVVRAAGCDAEIVQTDRARSAVRTADDPVDIFVLTNTPTDLEVDYLVDWDDIAVCPVTAAAALGAVFKTPADAVVAWPALFDGKRFAARAVRGAFDKLEGAAHRPVGFPHFSLARSADGLDIPTLSELKGKDMKLIGIQYWLNRRRGRPRQAWLNLETLGVTDATAGTEAWYVAAEKWIEERLGAPTLIRRPPASGRRQRSGERFADMLAEVGILTLNATDAVRLFRPWKSPELFRKALQRARRGRLPGLSPAIAAFLRGEAVVGGGVLIKYRKKQPGTKQCIALVSAEAWAEAGCCAAGIEAWLKRLLGVAVLVEMVETCGSH